MNMCSRSYAISIIKWTLISFFLLPYPPADTSIRQPFFLLFLKCYSAGDNTIKWLPKKKKYNKVISIIQWKKKWKILFGTKKNNKYYYLGNEL